MTSLSKRWQVAPEAPPSQITQFSHLHPLIVQVLYNRGITKPAEADAFLDDILLESANPFALQGIPAAVTRLRRALRSGEAIVVYGDFDADGVTATVLLVQTLRALGGNVDYHIPHRLKEGYGLRKETLARLEQAGAKLIVTVDCGIRSLDEIAYARQLGLDIIVTDHHSVGPDLPQAVAVIDPKRTDESYPFHELAGVGVAYRLAQALLRSHNQTPVTSQATALQEHDLVDLVALGTIADLVPLRGENRALVRQGLARINRMERPGIEALCRQSGLHPGQVNTSDIGYTLGPRINAAGRLAHASDAYLLLDTRYPAEADRLAENLGLLNVKRQQLTLENEKRARQLATEAASEASFLFAAAPDFVAGVVGLVASRLVDEFYRPAAIVEMGEEVSRGSARSIPEFHITQALDACADLLLRYGGHAAAAGFTVANEHLDELADRLQQIALQQLTGVELAPVLPVDVQADLANMSWDLQKALAQLEPCGYGNPQPTFLSRNSPVVDQRRVGKQGKHLKLTLSDGQRHWDAIAFRLGEKAPKLSDRVDVVYRLDVNTWNGHKKLQLNVADIRPSGADEVPARLRLDQGLS